MARFNGFLATINEKELMRYAGLARVKDFPIAYIKEAAKEVRLLSEPRGVYERYDYDAANHTVLSDPPLYLEGSSIQRHLAQSEKVYVMSVTIGEAVEERSRQLFGENNYTLGLLLDAAATTAVEQVANQLNEVIKNEAKRQGYDTTWRFSPGYGNWPIQVQPHLAKIIGTEQIGLTVTESMALFPRKSITAIVGCHRHGDAVKTKGRCSSCSMATSCAFTLPKNTPNQEGNSKANDNHKEANDAHHRNKEGNP